MKLIHQIFVYEGCSLEIVALQAQVPILSKTTNKNETMEPNDEKVQIKNNNMQLYTLHKKEKAILCLWFKTFAASAKPLENSFVDCLDYRKRLLNLTYNSKKELIISLIKEYYGWLNFLASSNEDPYQKFNSSFIMKYLLIYNDKLFYLDRSNKKTNQFFMKLNPFIGYWLISKTLRNILQLDIKTLFLPELSIADVEEIKNLKKI